MSDDRRTPTRRRLFTTLMVVTIAGAMAASLARNGGAMARATAQLNPGAIAVALVLSLAYRVVNAGGWGLILRSMGEPVGLAPAARIWLASEACRWLPGGLWSFGSRAVLASRRGIGRTTAATSLVLELAVTVVAWLTIAALGGSALRPPGFLRAIADSPAPVIAGFAVAFIGLGVITGVVAARSRRARAAIETLRQLGACGPSPSGLSLCYAFYVAMGLSNGVAFWSIVAATPEGAGCPLVSAVAANAAAWLAGFFAFFAPGGLVVREACLVATLSPWMPAEQALAVALAWRLVQVVAEIVCFACAAAFGLPASLSAGRDRRAPAGTVVDRLCRSAG